MVFPEPDSWLDERMVTDAKGNPASWTIYDPEGLPPINLGWPPKH